jgi:2-polyprenyl-3-methyl-5-hydroxy-6-metoxy-1,4-benzoquinol methylase
MDARLKKHPLGFYEISNKPSSEALQNYYAEKYYQEENGSYRHEYSHDELKLIGNKLIQRHTALNVIQSKRSKCEKNSFLDVGCGEGYALSYFREQGYVVKGLDFSSAGAVSKNPTCLDVLTAGNLFDLLDLEINSTQRYDVIWLQNVLEHVLDPVKLMISLRDIISDSGIAVITVPNDCSAIQMNALDKQYIDRSFWVAPPDHLSYFDYNSLINIAEGTGWNVADLIGDFPIDWFLYHPGSNYVSDSKLGGDAHNARVQIENLIAERSVDDVLNFWRAMARIGSGRDLTIFVTPNVLDNG